MFSVAVQQPVAGTALGRAWLQPLQQGAGAGPPLDGIFDDAALEGTELLALRLAGSVRAGTRRDVDLQEQ